MLNLTIKSFDEVRSKLAITLSSEQIADQQIVNTCYNVLLKGKFILNTFFQHCD